MKPKVFITRLIPQKALDLIAQTCDYRMWDKEDENVPRHILESEVRDVDGLFALLTEKIDPALLDLAPNLKIVANMAVGFDNVNIQECSQRNIIVTNTPGVLTETTADLTFALMLAVARRIPEAETFLRQNRWKTWSPMMLTGMDVYNATLGIVGLGRIGQAVARRARGFSMDILYADEQARPDLEASLGVKRCSFHDLFKTSDFVTIHVPLSDDTYHLVGAQELALMKPASILINTSRGKVIDERELYRALSEKRIFGAGLDVFETEPVSRDNPLMRLDNVVMLPHIASASIATRTKMAVIAAENLTRVLSGSEPLTPVNWPFH